MKTFRNLFFAAVVIGMAWGIFGTVKPYWDKYWIEKDMQEAAVYGTKHDQEKTRAFLDRRMIEAGRGFKGEDFLIDKNEENDVTIRIKYLDEIRVFGKTLKELEFALEASASEVKEYY